MDHDGPDDFVATIILLMVGVVLAFAFGMFVGRLLL